MSLTKSYVTPQEIEQARQLDLLSYLQRYRPDELIKVTRGVYSLRSHDSLKISNGKWYRWSKGVGGVSALDYLVKVEDMPFVEAVRHLCGCTKHWPFPKTTPQPKEPKPFVLPKCHSDNKRVIQYLMQRGLSEETIQMCIDKGILYEDYRHNCCFVGFDTQGVPRYAMLRSSDPCSTFLREADGSDKRYSFSLSGSGETLYVFESAIDCLSFIELQRMKTDELKPDNYLSLSGVYRPGEGKRTELPAALQEYLSINEGIRHIALCLDNDEAGRSAALAICAALPDKYTAELLPPQSGKDYNELLMLTKGIPPNIRVRKPKERRER